MQSILLCQMISLISSVPQAEKKKIRKRVFTYDKMDDQKWATYAKATDSRIVLWDLHNMHISNAQDLEYYWSIIQRQIIESAITTIDNHMTSVHDKQEKLPQVIID